MYNINTILTGANIILTAATFGAVLGIWRVKVRLAKDQKLINQVGPIPPVLHDPVTLHPIGASYNEPVAPTIEIKKEEKVKLPVPKVKKQIDLLTKELDRLKSL